MVRSLHYRCDYSIVCLMLGTIVAEHLSVKANNTALDLADSLYVCVYVCMYVCVTLIILCAHANVCTCNA